MINKEEIARQEGFKIFEGKTISKVDCSSVNVTTFYFTDGTKVSVDCDDQVYGIGMMTVR